MALDLTFWIIAWSLMALAFFSATLAIIIGAIALDREPSNSHPAKLDQ